MQEFVASQRKVWRRIQVLAKYGDQKLAAIAYFTDSEIIAFSKGDIVITDASVAAIKSAQTSKHAVRDLCRAGVDVYTVQGLHAKVLILGSTLVVGSMNASRSSLDGLIEAALIVNQPGTVNDAREWITGTIKRDAKLIDETELAKIMKIKVTARPRGPRGVARTKVRRTYASMPASKSWWYLGTGLREMTGSDLDAVDAVVAQTKRKLVDTGLEVEAIELNLSLKVGSKFKRGDNVLYGYMHNAASASVLRDVKVRRNFIAGNKRYILVTYPKSSLRTEASWGRVKVAMRQHGVKLSKPYSIRGLDPSASEALLKDWKRLR